MNQEPLSKALILCPSLGLSSEIWVDRQLRGFQRISPTVACWENHLDPELPPPCPLALIPNPRTASGRAKRWWHRVQALPGGCNFFGARDEVRRELTSLFVRVRPSVVLCHFGQTALLVLPVAKKFGVPVVAHFHGQDLSSALHRDRWYRWSLLANLRRFAAVIVVGSQQRDWVAEQGVAEERLYVIPCGAPVKYFNPPASRPAGPFRCVAVSRLVPWKGLDHTLRAFAILKRTFPDASISIIGDGEERSELEAQADALGIREATCFTGPMPPEEVRREYERADVFVQHSLNHPNGWVEGFGVSIAEASASGLPVVVSHCGGIIDQVVDGETGFIVPQRDDQAMAAAMMKLAADPGLRKKMGEAGRKRVVENFDTSVQISKLEEVLLKAAAQGGAKHLPQRLNTATDSPSPIVPSGEESGIKAPLVSIGLPVRNGGQFLEETLESICAQTFVDFEVIISDNASTDHTREICERYAARDSRIQYHRLTENLGAAPNYNRVFALARGKYFKWAAHDDVLKPSFLECCVRELERSPEAVVAYTRTEIIDDRGSFVKLDDLTLVVNSGTSAQRLKQFYRKIRLANPIFGLIRTDALQKTRLIDSFISSDLVLLAELLMLGEFREYPEPLFQRRLHDGCSVRAHPLEQDRQVWFDTNRAVRNAWIPFSYRLSWEYSRSVLRMSSSWRERVACMLVTLRWRWWRSIVMVLRQSLARWIHTDQASQPVVGKQ